MLYECVTKCYFADRLFYVGDQTEFGPDIGVPEHFKEIGVPDVAKQEPVVPVLEAAINASGSAVATPESKPTASAIAVDTDTAKPARRRTRK